MCFIKWCFETIKKYWMELVLVFLLTVVLMVLSSNFTAGETFTLSEAIIVLLPAFFPLISGFLGGFLVSMKSKELKEILFIPLIAVILSVFVYSAMYSTPILSITDEEWNIELSTINEYYSSQIELNEFKAMNYFDLFQTLIDFFFASIGAGLIGTSFGALIEKKFNAKKRK